MSLKKLFSRILSGKQYKIQSFTYYVPSPPARNTGYREKQFDKAFHHFINKGYEIISIQTQSNSGSDHSGMWIICTVRALNKEAEVLNFEDDFEPILGESPESPVEGLYYMDS